MRFNGRGLALCTATVLTGLSAGLFAAFGYAVMPGLGQADDRTFVVAMQEINKAILNPWFMLAFGGSLIALITAAALHRGTRALPWILAALALYVVVLGITIGVNVPLNDELEAAGRDAADLPGARADFEDSWVLWNSVRAVVSLAAFALAAWAPRVPAAARRGSNRSGFSAAPL
ncbi:anthrone oxygenase family protein [Streptomyces blattellae]|uniref:anthrone oxygenase family protein n=1 Tax=Streptomyces blattellae TaxID=2569855 RepID=UPI0012B96CCA|nr:anthrone oxygenase family protein [Streptomyces blattellae]